MGRGTLVLEMDATATVAALSGLNRPQHSHSPHTVGPGVLGQPLGPGLQAVVDDGGQFVTR